MTDASFPDARSESGPRNGGGKRLNLHQILRRRSEKTALGDPSFLLNPHLQQIVPCLPLTRKDRYCRERPEVSGVELVAAIIYQDDFRGREGGQERGKGSSLSQKKKGRMEASQVVCVM